MAESDDGEKLLSSCCSVIYTNLQDCQAPCEDKKETKLSTCSFPLDPACCIEHV
jgi:hypothetical protein